MLYQSFTMAWGINVIAVFVACAIVASATNAPFPHGKTTVYNYRTTVRTTTNEENLYASQYALQGTLDVTHDTRDPELANAYNVVLSNVVTDMHNGEVVDYDEKPVAQSIDDKARAIQEPFLIIYNENGTLQAVKMGENEPEWSKNMKMAMASMLQLDLPEISVEKLANEPLTFTAQEKTIYGDCSVTYNVHPMDSPEEFRVNKTFSPIDCDGFHVQEFNNVDNDHCKAKKPEQMFTDSSRDVEIAKQADGMLIKKLIAHGDVHVLSANAASYPFFIITNTTFEFLRSNEKSDKDSLGNFANSQKIDDLTYRQPEASYMPNTAVDVTQGRHVVDVSGLPSHLEELLSDAFNYIHGDHLSPTELNWDHAQTINKIFHTMRYMDADQLQAVFDKYENSDLRRDIEIKNIFLGVVAQVGTPASCHFTRNIIMKNKIMPLAAVDMLTKLPLNVKVPTTELLAQMEDLMKFGPEINAEVRKAGILCFSSLVYRTFKNLPNSENSPLLIKYIRDFFNGLKDETTYEMKIVYLMGIKNIQVGKIYELLEPLITGNQDITPDPDRFQLLAIWAMDKSVEGDYPSATRILWPIMENEALPTKLRIAAYEILMKQAPDEKSARKVHDYVSTKGNEHFYNYHYTTLDSIARSEDHCKYDIRAIAKSILEETQYPRESDKDIPYTLSGVATVSYQSPSFIYGGKADLGMVVNELTGDPEVLKFEHVSVDNDGPVSDLSIQVHVEGSDGMMNLLRPYYKPRLETTKISEVLQKVKASAPAMKDLTIDIVLMRKGRVIMANHYDFETLSEITDYTMEYYFNITGTEMYNYQNVIFDRLYERQLPNDIGVPIMVQTRSPALTSLQLNHTNMVKSMDGLDLDMEFKKWNHGDYSMSVYNPMKDVWHAIRSSTLTEIHLPIHSQILPGAYPNVLKFRFRERPGSPTSALGVVLRAKFLVTVDEDCKGKLKESCDTCLHQEESHDGSVPEDAPYLYRERVFDDKNVGLRGFFYTYRGEYGYLSERFLGYKPTWEKPYKTKIPSTWTDLVFESPMDIHYWYKWMTADVQGDTSGCILKIEPSPEFAFSEINVILRGKLEDYDKNQTNLERAHAMALRCGVTFDTISSATGTTAGSVDVDLEVDVNQGHLSNKGSLRITRKAPGEQNFKICMDANKNYPIPPSDMLKLGDTKEEIDSKWSLSYGYTDDEECDRNQTLLSFNVKAQLSEEQRKQFKDDLENSACGQDTKNPLFSTPKNLVPRTVDCLDEAIKYTTPRKYTVDVTHKQLPSGVTSTLYDLFTHRIQPSEEGSFQFTAEFPMTTNTLELHLTTNTSDIKDMSLPLKDLRSEGRGPVLNPLWDFPLDNSRFELQFLWNYISDDIRYCFVYPGIVDRADAGKTPFAIPSDEWVLLSGDYLTNRFAIFAKQPRPNYLSFLISIRNQQVEFSTRESDNALVVIGEGIEPETGIYLPTDEYVGWRMRISRASDHFVVHLGNSPVVLRIGSNYISIAHDSDLQGTVDGLCGRLIGIPFSSKSDVYSMKDTD